MRHYIPSEEDFEFFRKVIGTFNILEDAGADISGCAGACAISSYLVFKYLKKKGYNPRFIKVPQHCWVEVLGKYIDLTGEQFGFGSIIIADKNDLFFKEEWPYNQLLNPEECKKNYPNYYLDELIAKCKSIKNIEKATFDWNDQSPIILKKEPFKTIVNPLI